jgi:hypothetical protein
MKELVRCRPCGFVIEADKLGEVCPACGLPRFKTLATPILRVKIIFNLIILLLSVALFFIAPQGNLYLLSIALSILSLGAGFQLGLWGKKLINVILPGSYPQKKGSKVTQAEGEKA